MSAADVVDAPVWEYHRGEPDRSGAFAYTHLLRGEHDPDETRKRGRAAGALSSTHWRRTDSVDAWAARIDALLGDGEPRTFNAITVELTGCTADVWAGKAPDDALWQLVRAERVVWACELGAVFFLRVDFLNGANE